MPDSLLRVLTCGSVDDGKSTLIGRLLFECGTIPDDVMAVLERDSKRFGTVEGGIDYALLVDGLAAERQVNRDHRRHVHLNQRHRREDLRGDAGAGKVAEGGGPRWEYRAAAAGG